MLFLYTFLVHLQLFICISMSSSIDSLLPIIRGEFGKLKLPSASDKVHKDECVASFDSPYTPGGLYVNLSTYNGYGAEYVSHDVHRNGGRLYVHFEYTETSKKESKSDEEIVSPPPTKLALNVEGGFLTNKDKYDVLKSHSLAVWDGAAFENIPLPNNDIPEFISNICDAIIQHNGMRLRSQAEAWDGDKDRFESKYAASLPLFDNGKKISNNPKTWRCEASGEVNNLWLNLSTGYIGGGRKQWDGSGGSGAALQHYIDTGRQYPLCVKLGTITPNGADVWSYAEDEDTLVLDSKLGEHLRHWGIDLMSLQKTEKSLIELEAELNATYDWTRILEGSDGAERLSGPGYVGLWNIGSSCYMNSVLQAMFNIPEIRTKYTDSFGHILETTSSDPSGDLPLQLSKIGRALFSDRYCAPAPSEGSEDQSDMMKYSIAPYMFKYLVGQNHREFSSGRQQDASEYFQFLLDAIDRSERTNESRLIAPRPYFALPTAKLFEFEFERRLQCQKTGQVRYVSGRETLDNMLSIQIPVELATAKLVVEHDNKRLKTEEENKSSERMEVPLAACLDRTFASEVIEIINGSISENNGRVDAVMTTKFKNFPVFLVVKMVRYFVDSEWKQKKIAASVKMPETLDLTGLLSTGIQPDEVLMPEGSVSASNNHAPNTGDIEAAKAAEDALTMQLVSMGFGENGCRRAARNTANSGGDVEVAMNWVLEHMGDPDFDAPIEPLGLIPAAATTAAGLEYSEDDVAMLMSFGGFTESRVKKAMRETGGNSERAADWLFSHVGEDDAEDAVPTGAVDFSGEGGTPHGSGKYKLLAIVSHMGRNTEHGHYVCHVLRNGQWVLFNDDIVVSCKNPPLEYGFMYFYGPMDA